MSERRFAFKISGSCFVFDRCIQQRSSKHIYALEICSDGCDNNYCNKFQKIYTGMTILHMIPIRRYLIM